MVLPHRAYFGAKDAQQVAVIKQLVEDLSFPIDIVVCPTFREEDGLAMSSRNVNLTGEEREQATVLSIALREAEKLLTQGSLPSVSELKQYVNDKIQRMPLAQILYVEILTYPGLEPIEQFKEETIIVAVAVKFGKTRLIDNITIQPCQNISKVTRSSLDVYVHFLQHKRCLFLSRCFLYVPTPWTHLGCGIMSRIRTQKLSNVPLEMEFYSQ